MYIYDSVLEEIKKHIAEHLPERGGALLGEVGKPYITKFIYDETAETTMSTYSPSRLLNEMVQVAEFAEELEFKGIIHSHPGSLDHPSGQDEVEIATGLRLNSHMPFYLAPIVSRKRSTYLANHELELGQHKVSFYAGYRENIEEERSIFSMWLTPFERVKPLKIEITPIPIGRFEAELMDATSEIDGLVFSSAAVIDYDDEPILVGELSYNDEFTMLMVFDHHYTKRNPTIFVTYADDSTVELTPRWSYRRTLTDNLEETIDVIVSKMSNDQKRTPKKTLVKTRAKGNNSLLPVPMDFYKHWHENFTKYTIKK